MGADLYINSLHAKCMAEHEPLFTAAVAERDRYIEQRKTETDARLREQLQARIDEAQERVREHYQAMYAEGYFRDSYNGSNLLWRLGLSWWRDLEDYTDEDGDMPPEKVRQFRERVAEAPFKPLTPEEMAEGGGFAEEDTAQQWNDYFLDKRQHLLAFLDQAIELNEPVICSV